MLSGNQSSIFSSYRANPLQNGIVMKKLCPFPQPSKKKNKSTMWVLYTAGSPAT